MWNSKKINMLKFELPSSKFSLGSSDLNSTIYGLKIANKWTISDFSSLAYLKLYDIQFQDEHFNFNVSGFKKYSIPKRYGLAISTKWHFFKFWCKIWKFYFGLHGTFLPVEPFSLQNVLYLKYFGKIGMNKSNF